MTDASAAALGLLFVAGGYLIGSIPFAVIAGRIVRGIDIRDEGSGNAGATNVLRVLGWKAALAVVIGDIAKGFLPVLFAPRLFGTETDEAALILKIAVLAGVLAGHAFPVWAGFRGGKGVASSAGGVSAIFPPAAPVCLVVFLAVLAASRYVSLASLAAAWILPAAYAVLSRFGNEGMSPWVLGFFIAVAAAVTALHRKNIKRLLRGEEKRISQHGEGSGDAD